MLPVPSNACCASSSLRSAPSRSNFAASSNEMVSIFSSVLPRQLASNHRLTSPLPTSGLLKTLAPIANFHRPDQPIVAAPVMVYISPRRTMHALPWHAGQTTPVTVWFCCARITEAFSLLKGRPLYVASARCGTSVLTGSSGVAFGVNSLNHGHQFTLPCAHLQRPLPHSGPCNSLHHKRCNATPDRVSKSAACRSTCHPGDTQLP